MGNMVQPKVAGSVAVRSDGQVDWRFRLGQCISHKEQSMPSLVMSRTTTSKGREIYGVRSFAIVDPNRDRMMLGDSLVDVVPGSEPCHDCLLFLTGICPGQ